MESKTEAAPASQPASFPVEIDPTLPVVQVARALATEGLTLRSIDGSLRIEAARPNAGSRC